MEEIPKKKSRHYKKWSILKQVSTIFFGLLILGTGLTFAYIAYSFNDKKVTVPVIAVSIASFAFLYTTIKVINKDLNKWFDKKIYVAYVQKVKIIESQTNLENEINEFLSKAKENYYTIVGIEPLSPQSSLVHFISPLEELNNDELLKNEIDELKFKIQVLEKNLNVVKDITKTQV